MKNILSRIGEEITPEIRGVLLYVLLVAIIAIGLRGLGKAIAFYSSSLF